MLNRRFAASVSLVSLSLVLAACGGGGGVASTPTPAPAPAPPPPPPTNDDLLGDLYTQSFENVATSLNASFSQTGAGQGELETIEATISYDQDDESYSLTTPTGSITFLPTDVDDSLSSADRIVFVQNEGETTNTLTLTKSGETGALTYKYVGGAFWESIDHTGGSPVEGSFDTIVYGIKTEADAVPRSGSATYALDALGTHSDATGMSEVTGEGTAWVDFGAGNIMVLGELVLAPGSAGSYFTADADLSSTSGEFSGSFTYAGSAELYEGSITGSLFGPEADEFGATFAAAGLGQDGTTVSGALLGRRDVDAANTHFDPSTGELANSQTFVSQARQLKFSFGGILGQTDYPEPFSDRSVGEEDVQISFDAQSNRYMLAASHATAIYNEDTGSFETFFDDWEKDGLKYVTRGTWSHGSTDEPYIYTSHIFGFETAADNLPVSGRGGYALDFDGYAADNNFPSLVDFEGSGWFRVDFATGEIELKGWFDWDSTVITNNSTSSIRGNGAIAGSGAVSSSANDFEGSILVGGIGLYEGTFGGSFFGPNAEEVGGVFSASEDDNMLVGSFTGKEDQALADSTLTLAELDESTPLGGTRMDYPTAARIKFTYDPDTGLYSIPFLVGIATDHIVVGPDDIDDTLSDASRTYYVRDEAGGAVGFIFNAGEDNPEIQLTYSTFAAFQRVAENSSGAPGTEKDRTEYFSFGVVTPAAAVPKAGKASYSGIVYGDADVPELFYEGDIGGTSKLSVDFAKNSLQATLNLVAKDGNDTAIGSFDTTADIGPNGFSGQILYGNFFGPNAEEFGAVFDIVDDGPAGRMTASGVTVGKRD